MVFLRGYNQHDSWQRFCAMHRETLAKCGLPTDIIQTEHRFRDLLQEGTVETGKTELSLASISDSEWNSLERFVAAFFLECESCAPRERFPAFFKEAERRNPNASVADRRNQY